MSPIMVTKGFDRIDHLENARCTTICRYICVKTRLFFIFFIKKAWAMLSFHSHIFSSEHDGVEHLVAQPDGDGARPLRRDPDAAARRAPPVQTQVHAPHPHFLGGRSRLRILGPVVRHSGQKVSRALQFLRTRLPDAISGGIHRVCYGLDVPCMYAVLLRENLREDPRAPTAGGRHAGRSENPRGGKHEANQESFGDDADDSGHVHGVLAAALLVPSGADHSGQS